jgi:galactokinase
VVRAEAVDRFVATLRREYAAKTGIDADCFVCMPSDGAFALAKKSGVA